MEYINFTISLPVSSYLKIESMANQKNVSKNKILIDIIFQFYKAGSKDFGGKKNAGFYTFYNKN